MLKTSAFCDKITAETQKGASFVKKLEYRRATKNDLGFISDLYAKNIAALHGADRTKEDWQRLLAKEETAYYIVLADTPVAWFRTDIEDGGFWLGMLQVEPQYKRQGIGRYVLAVSEKLARAAGFAEIGVHTTEDNAAAQGLYTSAGYVLTEVGPCTTADGVERVGHTYCKTL